MKKDLVDKVELPVTYKWIVRFFFPSKKSTVLDLGCGKGIAARLLNSSNKHIFTGVDIFPQYLAFCKKLKLYQNLKKLNIVEFSAKPKSYDVVLLFQVIEHLEKKKAKKLLYKVGTIARKIIIITTPNGRCHQHEYDANPYQKHLSEWSPDELQKMGFWVFGQGLGALYRHESYAVNKNVSLWQKCLMPFSLLLFPVIFFKPKFSAQLIAIKKY